MTTATRLTSRDSYITVRTDRTTERGVDLLAVERAVNGELPESMTDAELAYAARVLSEHNVSRDESARRLSLSDYVLRKCQDSGWKPDTITSWRENSQKKAVAA
ncbi:hypothetical protein JK359_33445 [Streptomyces actinomycinicus]|uniref:Uncharacterized protein n=1 Tax=Streptomyces actinomycinicus TaxID=1695166 RepID=A0A937ENY4_9ACTN|nr:hypothetical protein [Streptomyces actinomycinicus]MBL1086812.1 hypothetical protein [Streptomyces actinomycinicus]